MTVITKQYWCVRDTNPASQVFTTDPAQGASVGTMISNTNATFESWLQLHDESQQMPIIASAPTSNNGSGKIRVTIPDTSFLQTGMVFDYVGDVTGDLGATPVTVVNSTHIDFTNLSFTTPDSRPLFYGATFIDTLANLYGAINTFNVNNLSANVYLGVNNPSMSGDITLTNPMLFVQEINNSGAGHSLILPQMNLPYSLPIGVPVTVTNTDSPSTGIAFAIKNTSGAPLWPTLYGSDSLTFVLTANSVNGSFLFLDYLPGSISGNLIPPTAAGQIPITQASRVIHWITPSSANLSDTVSNGSWTPSDQSGGSLTFTSVTVEYERIGNVVRAFGRLTFPATADGNNVSIGGLPIAVPNRTAQNSPCVARLVGKGIAVIATPAAGTSTFGLRNAVTDAILINSDCSSLVLVFNLFYSAS